MGFWLLRANSLNFDLCRVYHNETIQRQDDKKGEGKGVECKPRGLSGGGLESMTSAPSEKGLHCGE